MGGQALALSYPHDAAMKVATFFCQATFNVIVAALPLDVRKVSDLPRFASLNWATPIIGRSPVYSRRIDGRSKTFRTSDGRDVACDRLNAFCVKNPLGIAGGYLCKDRKSTRLNS